MNNSQEIPSTLNDYCLTVADTVTGNIEKGKNDPRDSVNDPRDSANDTRDSVNNPRYSANDPRDSVNDPMLVQMILGIV